MTESVQIDIPQGSDEWLAWRREHFMASEAAIVMGCPGAYWETKTPADLRRIKAGEPAPEPSAETRKLWADGHRVEAEVRGALNDAWHAFAPTIFERGEFGASLDGWDEGSAEWLEVKAPRDATSVAYRMTAQRTDIRKAIPDHYWWQLVQQAHCAPDGATVCRYIVAPANGAHPREIMVPREMLIADWPQLEAAWRAFADERPNLPPESDEALALEYIEALRESDAAKQRLDRAKTRLLAAGPRIIADLVAISEGSVRGRVDWKTAAEDAGLDEKDAEDYRAEPAMRTTIKLLAEA